MLECGIFRMSLSGCAWLYIGLGRVWANVVEIHVKGELNGRKLAVNRNIPNSWTILVSSYLTFFVFGPFVTIYKMGPFVMGPFVAGVLLWLGPLVTGPFVMGPFVMGPFVMVPSVMGPYVGVPLYKCSYTYQLSCSIFVMQYYQVVISKFLGPNGTRFARCHFTSKKVLIFRAHPFQRLL